MRRRRRTLAVALVLIVGGLVAAAVAGVFSRPSLTPAQIAARAARQLLRKEQTIIDRAASQLSAVLPSKTGAPAPAIPAELFKSPTPSHEVLGFVPYYELGSTTPADLADVSTVAYFALSVTGNGHLVEKSANSGGAGWSTLRSAPLVDLVTSAHEAGDHVLITIMSSDEATISSLIAHSQKTSVTLASSLAQIVEADHFDGVDIDLEGDASSERDSFVTFVKRFSGAFRQRDPKGTLVLDTYVESASSPSDFFDVAKLSHYVNALFVMAYDMDNPSFASSNDPALSPTLGLSDVSSLLDYTKVVSPKKIIFGVPFYGYDFSTISPVPGANTTTPTPQAFPYSSIVQANRSAKWDPASETPYTTFRRNGSWHETWYDDPNSLALRVALAEQFHVAGVGVWALGMEGSETSMLQALLGDASLVRTRLFATSS